MKKSKDYAEAKAEILDRLGVESLLDELRIEVTGRSGDYLQAHCPLPEHNDQNPSFSVHSRTGWAKCFGCGFEGSFFDLWAGLKGLGGFRDAVKELADRAGVGLPTADKNRGGRGAKQSKKTDSSDFSVPSEDRAIDPTIGDQCHQALLKRDKSLRWLKEHRGWTLNTIKRFKIGFIEDEDGERFSIPVYDREGRLVNIRKYRPNPPARMAKFLPYKRKGYGEARLFNLDALHESEIILCEGEPDAILACQFGFAAMSATGGAKTWKDEWSGLFGDKTVHVCFDIDKVGKQGAEKVARSLHSAGANVRIVRLPLDPAKYPKGDLTDYLHHENHTAKDLRKLLEEAKPWAPDPANLDANDSSDRPSLDASYRDLSVQVEQAWEVVAANCRRDPTNPVVLNNGGALAVISDSGDGPRLKPFGHPGLKHILSGLINWYSTDTEGRQRPAYPPDPVVAAMRERPHAEVPRIRSVVSFPVRTPNGDLVCSPGYNEAAQVWSSSDLRIPSVPEVPTEAEVEQARSMLLEPWCDFPFTNRRTAEAYILAAILTPLMRAMIDDPVPMFLFDAISGPGSGKTLLASSIVVLTTGRPPSVLVEARDDDEWRKRMLAVLLGAPVYILIDNVRRTLDSSALSALLTNVYYKDRILGQSLEVELPVVSTIMVTGNGIRCSNEIARRCVRVVIDAKTDKPWARDGFKHPDLRSYVLANRTSLIHAAHVLIQNWIAKGKPPGSRSLGSFESWARMIGGVLEAAGIERFLADFLSMFESLDEETRLWREFIAAWWDKHKGLVVSASQLYELAVNQDLLLPVLGDRGDRSAKTRLGKALSRQIGRQLGQYLVQQQDDTHAKRRRYYLTEVKGQGDIAEEHASSNVDDEGDDPW